MLSPGRRGGGSCRLYRKDLINYGYGHGIGVGTNVSHNETLPECKGPRLCILNPETRKALENAIRQMDEEEVGK